MAEIVIDTQPYLDYGFPEKKKQLAKLSLDQKLEWYAHQFQKSPHDAPIMFNDPAFKSFWKWNVLLPMKLKRLYYRIKNGEIFKHYSSITEIRAKRK